MSGVSLRVERERPRETYPEKCLKCLLRFGPVPQHMAFIMDGNRRYAAKIDKDRSFGHSRGYGKLESVIEWCSQVGVTAVTTYAFSIENFKRSVEEVTYLMKLAENKANYLFENKEVLQKYSICIVFSGNLSFLPQNLRNQCYELMEMTRCNKGFICNICLSYTSGEELAAVASTIASDLRQGSIDDADITASLVDQCLNTSSLGVNLPPVDVVVRTSGEKRLSDFLLWQTGFSMFAFVETLWPDFSLWDFATVILRYKWHHSTLANIRTSFYSRQNEPGLSENQLACVKKFCSKRAVKETS